MLPVHGTLPLLGILLTVAVFTFAWGKGAHAADSLAVHKRVSPSKASDRWIAEDKLDHLLVSAFLTGFGYYSFRYVAHNTPRSSLVFGASFSLSMGLGKEIYDKKSRRGPARPGPARPGTPSLKDVVADVIGISLAVVLFAAE